MGSYKGRSTVKGRRTLRDPKTSAAARRGEAIQTEAALKKYLARRSPHYKLHQSPYIPSVQSVKMHSFLLDKAFTPADGSNFSDLLSIKPFDVFDPMGAMAAGQPTGYAHLNALYNHYIVTRCEWKITVRNFYYHIIAGEAVGSKMYICNVEDNATSLDTQADTVKEILGARWANSLQPQSTRGHPGIGTRFKTLPFAKLKEGVTHSAGAVNNTANLNPGRATVMGAATPVRIPHDHLGSLTMPVDNAARRFIGLTGSSPGTDHFVNFFIMTTLPFDINNMDNPVQFDVELIQHVTWFEPKVDMLDEIS